MRSVILLKQIEKLLMLQLARGFQDWKCLPFQLKFNLVYIVNVVSVVSIYSKCCDGEYENECVGVIFCARTS